MRINRDAYTEGCAYRDTVPVEHCAFGHADFEIFHAGECSAAPRHDSAKDLATQIEQWIKVNRERILAERARRTHGPSAGQ